MFKRKGYEILIKKECNERMRQGCCPICGLHKSFWKRSKSYKTCSTECTSKLWSSEFTICRDWKVLREQILKRDKYTCKHCGRVFEPFESYKLIVDHIKPIAIGGSEWDSHNLQTLCERDNKIKTAKDQAKIAKFRKAEKLKKLKSVFKA